MNNNIIASSKGPFMPPFNYTLQKGVLQHKNIKIEMFFVTNIAMRFC